MGSRAFSIEPILSSKRSKNKVGLMASMVISGLVVPTKRRGGLFIGVVASLRCINVVGFFGVAGGVHGCSGVLTGVKQAREKRSELMSMLEDRVVRVSP